MTEQKAWVVAWKHKVTGVEGHGQPTELQLAKTWVDAMNKQCPDIFHYVVSKEELKKENVMNEAFKEGQQVRVVKGRVPSDPIVGKTGTVVGSTNDLSFFWVVCLDGQTYTDDEFGGELLRTDEIETLY